MFEAFFVALSSVWADSGFSALTGGHVIMICVGLLLLYMAIAKGFEPLLLSPIAFGCILANIPKNGFEEPGVMSVIMYGIHHEVFPPLIFLGVGAMTDFGPLLANPKTLLLGAAAQAGVFVALLGAMLLGFTVQEAAAIGIIGGADGPTSIYLAVYDEKRYESVGCNSYCNDFCRFNCWYCFLSVLFAPRSVFYFGFDCVWRNNPPVYA